MAEEEQVADNLQNMRLENVDAPVPPPAANPPPAINLGGGAGAPAPLDGLDGLARPPAIDPEAFAIFRQVLQQGKNSLIFYAK